MDLRPIPARDWADWYTKSCVPPFPPASASRWRPSAPWRRRAAMSCWASTMGRPCWATPPCGAPGVAGLCASGLSGGDCRPPERRSGRGHPEDAGRPGDGAADGTRRGRGGALRRPGGGAALRLRRLGFYARNGCTPVYESFNCGLLCQVFVLGPAPADRADLKGGPPGHLRPGPDGRGHRPAPGASPEPPYWM